ncbi:MAG: hypothetical protein JSS76_18535 [Bacteroidetes bacterium]|nr:hypothetical protein [Bacteroidota bacterium]
MKLLRNLMLALAAIFVSTVDYAQADTTKSTSKTKHHEMKEKTKTTTHPDGSTRTVTKSKPTNKVVKADSTKGK